MPKRRRDAKGLTVLERRFVDEFLVDLNATQALYRVGYSGTGTRQMAYQIRIRPRVEAAIDAGIEAKAARARKKQDDVLEALGAIAFSNPQDLVVVDEKGRARLDVYSMPHGRAAGWHVSHVQDGPNTPPAKRQFGEVRVSRIDPTPALRDYGKAIGMYRDDVIVNMPMVVNMHGAPPDQVEAFNRAESARQAAAVARAKAGVK